MSPKPDKVVKVPGYADRFFAKDTSRTIDLTHPPADAWDRIRRGFAIPNMDTELTRQWTDYYAAHPEAVQRMAERSGKYLYYIISEINRRGLPTELALLPFIESAYDPQALSRSQASGLWQFVPATGEHYNLKQDWWRDERRDPIASTNAALDYLEYLFDMQGDWYLALASYNWGEGSVSHAMEKNLAAGRPTDYLSLDMPDETRNYVPKLQAIKNILADPQRYAVTLPPVSNTPYFVAVQKSQDMDVDVAAKLAEMPLSDFKALNPAFNRPIIRGDHSPLLLPADHLAAFNANVKAYKGELATWKVYQAQRGESYAKIAKLYGVTTAQLRQMNNIPARSRTAMNQPLLVPGAGNVHLASLESTTDVADMPPRGVRARDSESDSDDIAPRSSRMRETSRGRNAVRRVPNAHSRGHINARSHTVRSGDTLFGVAKKFGTDVRALRALNNLRSDHLKVGAKLRIPGTSVRG
jgi:membrane-bound lytic murein transglycosylase D